MLFRQPTHVFPMLFPPQPGPDSPHLTSHPILTKQLTCISTLTLRCSSLTASVAFCCTQAPSPTTHLHQHVDLAMLVLGSSLD